MQPNDRQGYYQPGQGQPAQPMQPVRPVQPIQPLSQPSIAETSPQPTQPVQPPVAPATPAPAAAMQQALAEQPAPPQVPQPPAPGEPTPLPDDASAEVYEDEGEYSDEPVTWSAQEYIHREKGTAWFFFFAVVIVALIAVSVLTKAWSFTALIVVIALVIVVYTRRPPRELTYSLTDEGLVIDGTLHKFSGFKSFGIIHDGEEFSVMLIPTQRFQPGISVYFPEEAGEDIVDMLGARLPMKDLKLDAVDRIVRLLRL